jgi:hypothetical protein
MTVVQRTLVLALAAAAVATGLAAPSLSAPAPITIAARPADLLRDRLLTLYGSIPSNRLKEVVVLEARDCGQSFYRQVARVETTAGGRWVWPYFTPGISASIRASWNGRTSVPVRVRDRAYVELRQAGPRRFSLSVRAKVPFAGRRVLLQRFDPARGWTTVRSAELMVSGAPPGSSYVFSSARLTASLPAGSLARGLLPAAQARPCYLAGRSNMLRIP